MKRQLHVSSTYGGKVCALILIFLLQSRYVCSAVQSDVSESIQHKILSPTWISAEQARIFLNKLKLGTVSQLPGTETILVTGEPNELSKAAAVLGLIDTESGQQFDISVLSPASEAKNLPSNSKIAAVAGDNISIGTFSEPPDSSAAGRAIIDVHDGMVLLIAQPSVAEKILTGIEKLQRPDTQQVLPPAEQPGQSANGGPAGTPKEPVPPLPPAGSVETREIVFPPEPKAAESKQPNEADQFVIVDTNQPLNVPNGDDVIKLDLPDKVNILQVLGLAGQYLGLDFMYDPDKVKGEVVLQIGGKLKGPITVKELYPLLENVLKFKNFVMTRRGNLVIVAPKEEALDIDPTIQSDTGTMQQIQTGDVVITKVFTLEYIDATSAKNFLVGMKLGVDISAIPEGKKLIVTEFAYRMPRVEELLRLLDKPGEPKKFRFRQLKYTMAQTLAEKVKILAEQLGTVSITIPETAADQQEYSPSPRQPNENDQAYNIRIARERALWLAQRQQQQQQRAVQIQTVRALTGQPEPAAKPTVYLDADERTNRVLMIGLEEQLQDVDELIEALDVQQQDLRSMKLYRVEHVSAEDVRNKLAELGIITVSTTETARRRTTRTTTTRASLPGRITQPSEAADQQQAMAQMYSPVAAGVTGASPEQPLVEQPQVVVIEQTNSLLVNATAEQHVRIASIISYVDSRAEQTSIPYVVYPLENQDPNQLASVLERLITQTTTNQDEQGKIISTTQTSRTEEEIVIVPDAKTYSLIVYASKENQQWINSLIKQLDEYRPQVLLDVTLVEITKNEEFTSDLDLVRKFPRFETGGTMSGAGPSALLSPFPGERILEAASVAGSGGTAFYADRHIQALLTIMQKKGYGRVLAKPKLLVNDNEEGTIKTEENTNIVQEQTNIIPGSAATAPTATTSVAFHESKAGIELTIAPHISKGDQLQLSVNLQRSDFRLRPDYTITSGSEKRTGPTPPDILLSNVNTKVTVPDGTTIILGGLERLNQTKGGTKVPILGDIPFIGGLFRNTANTDSQSRLYVFVKAHILRPGKEAVGEADIKVISQRNQDRFESYELQMQNYADWPGIRPKPMDPLRVLNGN